MAKTSEKTQISPTAIYGYTLDKQLAQRDAKQLGLYKGDLPNSIKEVISTLTQAGFEAYIVGGGVRDSLLGLKPKDFDAVTNAKPIEIKEVFGKRCRIIGRRFQLCHVYSGRDMIEVATFRAPPKDDTFTTEEGMLTRDNVWGDIYQDVVRRDFSINALYYQPFENIVYDFCDGLTDIRERKIRLLGDTQKRIEEDPVRLLRALRFKAKLEFTFDKSLKKQFHVDNWALLSQVSRHRLYDETQKMFTGGYLVPLLPLLFDYGAFNHLLFYPPKFVTPLVERVTINTDKRITSGKSINPAFFYATILWENYLFLLHKLKKNHSFGEAQLLAANKVMDKQRQYTAMPKFAEQFIKDIWLIQPKLAEPRKKNLLKLFEHPRFRAGYDFLMLREKVEAKNKSLQEIDGKAITLDDESTNGMGHWWAWFQTLNAKQQQLAIDEFDLETAKQRFANVLSQENIIPTTTITEEEKPCDATYCKLSQQQQQEKDQLRLLSLANTNSSDEPPKPLWETSENEVSPCDKCVSENIAQNMVNKENLSISVIEDNTEIHDESQLLTPIPTQRKRRLPSSTLSIIEQQALNNN